MTDKRTMIIISIFSTLIGALVWALTTFATVDYVDKKHSEVREDLKEIKKMLFQIHREVSN